jgi:hypothetical protein
MSEHAQPATGPAARPVPDGCQTPMTPGWWLH